MRAPHPVTLTAHQLIPVLIPDDPVFAPALKLEVKDSRLGGLLTLVRYRVCMRVCLCVCVCVCLRFMCLRTHVFVCVYAYVPCYMGKQN